METLLMLLIVIIVAQVFAEAAKALDLPRVVGQIAAGILLGIPMINSYIMTNQGMELLALLGDIGQILLFFFVGLEIDIMHFQKNIASSLKVSLLNTLIPFILGFAVSSWLGLSSVVAIIVGVSLSVSAEAVSLDILEELNLLTSKIGQHIMTAGAVDDIVELLLISMVLAMIHTTIGGSGFLLFLGSIVIFIILVILARIYLIPKALAYFKFGKNSTNMFTGALVITLVMAAMSEKLGMGSLIGALIGGVLVRQILESQGEFAQEENITSIIRVISFGFLVPIFFVWVGLNVNIASMFENLWFACLLTLIAFIGTIGGSMLGIMWNGGSAIEGYIVGWGVNPKGDTELVLASLALQTGIIDVRLFSALIFMAIATTIISPIVFRYLVKKHHNLSYEKDTPA